MRKYTRQDYMEKRCTHAEYYLDLADFIGITAAMVPVKITKEHVAQNPALNQWGNNPWDAKMIFTRNMAARVGIKSWTLAENICCLKAIAKREVERNEA
jgi:hypothetical protein